MTEMGLKYLQHQETVRANKAKEALTKEQTDVNREVNFETVRSNLMREFQNQQSLDEAHRSNVAKETETNRSNVAKEQETNRANLIKESQTWTQMERDFLNSRAQIEETQKHNRKMEANDELKAYAAFNNAQTNYAKSFSEIYKNIMGPTFSGVSSIGGLVK